MNDASLILATKRLSREAPGAWDEFRKAFDSFVNTTKDKCVSAMPSDLQVAQGNAQMCMQLQKLFSGHYDAQAQKLEAKQNK